MWWIRRRALLCYNLLGLILFGMISLPLIIIISDIRRRLASSRIRSSLSFFSVLFWCNSGLVYRWKLKVLLHLIVLFLHLRPRFHFVFFLIIILLTKLIWRSMITTTLLFDVILAAKTVASAERYVSRLEVHDIGDRNYPHLLVVIFLAWSSSVVVVLADLLSWHVIEDNSWLDNCRIVTQLIIFDVGLNLVLIIDRLEFLSLMFLSSH